MFSIPHLYITLPLTAVTKLTDLWIILSLICQQGRQITSPQMSSDSLVLCVSVLLVASTLLCRCCCCCCCEITSEFQTSLKPISNELFVCFMSAHRLHLNFVLLMWKPNNVTHSHKYRPWLRSVKSGANFCSLGFQVKASFNKQPTNYWGEK